MFHRVWLGGPEPKRNGDLLRTWEHHHPDWTVRTWTETNLPPLRNQHLFDETPSYAGRADVVRYEMLARYGGVYIDADFEAFAPIDPLLEGVTAFAAKEDDHWVANGIMGASPGHALLERIVAAVASSPPGPPNVRTGPKFLTHFLERLNESDRLDFTIFPPPIFYPYHFTEPERAAGPFPGAYAAHHWDMSWVESP